MENFKGTKAPWSYHITGSKKAEYHNIQQGSFGGKTIALLYKDYTTKEENEANAKLIASAPELLEALIKSNNLLYEIETCEARTQYDKNFEIIDKILKI